MSQFRSKAKLSPPTPSEPSPHRTRAAYQDLVAGRTVQSLLATLWAHNRFVGAFDTVPGFARELLDDGIQLATHRATIAGAVLAETAAGLSFAGLEATRLALVHVDAGMQATFSTTPDWQIGAGGSMTAALELPVFTLHLEARNALVDPLFEGAELTGTVLILRAEATGRTLH